MTSGQAEAPYLAAVQRYGKRGSARFHVPGHKGGRGADPELRSALGDGPLLLDLPRDIPGVDLGPEPTPYQAAEALAAAAYGARATFFLTNGATQGNHALALALTSNRPVVIQRNSHLSIFDGLTLSGADPRYVEPTYDPTLGLAHVVTPESLERALATMPRGTDAFVVSPTYHGMVADIASLAKVVHSRRGRLIVDQSWGPHFGFLPGFPASATRQGADAVLTSTHKLASSLTQSAMLHVSSDRIDAEALEQTLRMLRSTSTSSLLLASLDAARRQLVVDGHRIAERTLAALGALRDALRDSNRVSLVGATEGQPFGVVAHDPSHLVLDVRGLRLSGHQVAAALQERFDVHCEMATTSTVLLLLGSDAMASELSALPRQLDCIAARAGEVPASPLEPLGPLAAFPATPVPVRTPRSAFLAGSESVSMSRAEGRVSAEVVAGYPPGVPTLVPGELVTREALSHLRRLVDAGVRLHGAQDPLLRTVRVVRQ